MVDQARLESACGRKVTVGSNPTLSATFEVIKGPARPTGKFALNNSGNATQLTFILDFQPKGLAKLMGPMIQKTMEAEVQTLEPQKEYL